MKKSVQIPRNASEATKRGHKPISKGLKAAVVHAKGAHISPNNAKPGDVAWVGPCEATGTRIVCYFDENMDPSDCRNQPC